MTSESSIDVREVVFINERCRRDYFELPAEVGESADEAIDAVQNGRRLSPKMFSQLSGKLSGIDEIKIPYDSDTYRVYVTLECKWIVMVLDAGIKKSNEGKKIPQWQQERLEQRLSKARQYCKAQGKALGVDYAKRQALRDAYAKRTEGRKGRGEPK